MAKSNNPINLPDEYHLVKSELQTATPLTKLQELEKEVSHLRSDLDRMAMHGQEYRRELAQLLGAASILYSLTEGSDSQPAIGSARAKLRLLLDSSRALLFPGG